ncbi:MAG: hypothetical protein ABIK09_08570 [Pseudomonadota bacterium]
MDDKKLLNEITAAQTFLDDKIKKEKKSLKIRLVAGIIVTIVVFSYMFWLFQSLTSIGTPQGMRTVIVETIRNQGTQLLGMAVTEIKANKSEIINLLTEKGLDQLVEILMREGKSKLRGMITGISNDTIEELNGHFEAVLEAKQDELSLLMDDPSKGGALEELIVKAFENELRDSVGSRNFDTTFNEPIGEKLKAASEQLHMIHVKLKELADKDILSHRETLMIRFIKMWGSYVADIGSDDKPEDLGPAGSGRPNL